MVYRGDFDFRRRGGRAAGGGGWVARVGWQKEGPLLGVAEKKKKRKEKKKKGKMSCPGAALLSRVPAVPTEGGPGSRAGPERTKANVKDTEWDVLKNAEFC